jgi:hypothetical protein
MKSNILLFIAVVCLSLILYFEPGLEQPRRNYLTSLKSEQIHNISIQRQGLESIELEKTEHGWFMTKPFPLAANPLRLGTITALAEKRSFSHFPVTGKPLKKYHLDDPLIIVTLDDTKIAIGAEEVFNQHRYAMLDDSIHLIEGKVYYQLRANLDSFISLSLLPPGTQIKSIESSAWKLSIEQGHWLLTPDDPDISADSISTLLHHWKNAQALRIRTIPVTRTAQQADTQADTQADMQEKHLITVTLQDQSQIKYYLAGDISQPELIRLPWNISYQITPQLYKQLTTFSKAFSKAFNKAL